MRDLRDSCLPWLREIPCEWKNETIRHLMVSRDGGAWGEEPKDDSSGTICLRIADFDYARGRFKKCSDEDLTRREYTKAQLSRLSLKTGDILMEKSGGGEKTPVGRSVYYGGEYGPVLFANFMERLRFDTSRIEPEYAEYWLRAWYTCRCSSYYINQTTGIQNINLTLMLAKERIFYPSLSEQRRIVDYLDQRCGDLDCVISDIQSQIAVLEQYKRSIIAESVTKGLNPDLPKKDSGIQWVGLMPSHWRILRGKYVLSYLQKPVREDDGVITCFRDGEVTLRSNRREDGFTMSDKEIGYQGIDVGDLVVHGMDGFAGAIGISDSRGKASPVLNVLDTKQDKRYIMYYLRSMAYSDVFLALATGIRVRSCDLRWNKLAELSYPVPPLNEQQEIVAFIDSAIEKTDAVIAEKRAQLEVVEEYKRSLIFEYVTGKKEVPSA